MKPSQYQQKRQAYSNALVNEEKAKKLLKSYQSFCQDMEIHFDSEFWQEKVQTEENDLFCDFARFKWKNDLQKIEDIYQHFKDGIYNDIGKEKSNSSELNKKIDEQFLSEYKKLQKENPFKAYYNRISHYENNTNPTNSKNEHKQDTDNSLNEILNILSSLNKNSFTTQLLDEYKDFCNANDLPFDSLFFGKKINSGEEQKTIYEYLLQRWKKELEEVEHQWQKTRIALNSKSLASHLKELSNSIDMLAILGISFGDKIDGMEKYAPKNIEFLKILNTQLKKMKKIKEILDLLGRAFGKNNATKTKKEMENTEQCNPVIDYRAKEEIVGLYLGKELENILPAELALLNNEESAVLFDLKFLENKLMCFQQQGITFATQSQSTPKEVAKDERTGPIILCIDTSGSMYGDPENIAKAIALYLGQEAKKPKRAYFIIKFAEKIKHFELTKKKNINSLIDFLSPHSNGGTENLELALDYSLKLLEKETYEKADILIISDFIMQLLGSNILTRIKKQRQKKTTFNSLIIKNVQSTYHLDTTMFFDHNWQYSPTTGEIIDLIKPTSSP
ncbi:VWA domain-containing protein [Avibacterium paragallinarum]|uniref:VWA domain-containing protein n=1 Tax=Avibacterium paragallinarum TaxID=728 RepID=UPI001C99018D|nr:VWA domain-containing protein [Avibacterium paragallinarum]QZP16612.1 VWA domain-containing protein [Avibacterium paragallinarum]